MESVSASARVRIELGPLEGRLPVVPRLSVALVDFPRFGFDLTLYGGDLTLLPGLEAFLSAVLRDFVMRPYVLPGRFVVDLPFGGGEEAALGFDRPKGMLFLSIEAATRIPRMDLFSAADCYVKVCTTGGEKKKRGGKQGEGEGEKEQQQLGHWRRTRTIPNRNYPVWRQELRPFLIRDPQNELVDFVLMDADEWGNDDEIGRCSVKVSAVVAALQEERERRTRRRRGLTRPPSPVPRPEVDESESPAPAAVAASREREGIEEGEEGEASPSSSPFVSPPVAAAAPPPVSDRSGGGGRSEFFVEVPTDDEETRRALSPPSSSVGAQGAGAEEEEEEEEAIDGAGGASSSVQASRGSGSVGDTLELWLPCPRLSSSSSGGDDPASSIAREWRSPPPGAGGVSGRARKPAVRGGCWNCLTALLPGRKRIREPLSEGPPLLRVKICYHSLSEEEIELAGGGGRARGGGGREPAAAAPPPPTSIPSCVSLSSSSRAADILGGGILFVRPRQAKNLRPPPLWRRALLPTKWRAAWVVRVAFAGGGSEEGGPVSKGGTSPTFTEVRSKGERERERSGKSVDLCTTRKNKKPIFLVVRVGQRWNRQGLTEPET